MQCQCSVLMSALPSLLLTTGNIWNITESEKDCLMTPCVIVMCGCGCHILLSFLPSYSGCEFHCSFHLHRQRVQCQCSVLMSALPSLLLTTGNIWNITASENYCLDSSCDCGVWLWLSHLAVFPFSQLRR